MKKIEKPEDIREIDIKVGDLCNNVLIKYTCQFFTKAPSGFEPFGSGVFVKSEEKNFIFTASHVSEYMEKEGANLFIKIDHSKYVNVVGEIHQTDIDRSKNIDLAIIRLDPELTQQLEKPYNFLPISKLRKHEALIYAPHYCVLGYPAVNKKKEKGYLETGATFYLTEPCKDKVYKHYEYDPKVFYVLKMEGKGKDIKSGERSKVNGKFHGISGCGLWLILPHHNGKEYEIDYRLIGIMTEHHKRKYYCLVGNKIQQIVDALIALENIKIQTIK